MHLRILHREQGASVPHVDALILESDLNLRRELKQTQVVSHRSALLAHALAELLLRKTVGVDQPLISEGRFDGVQIFALDVLNEGQLSDILVFGGLDVGGDLV